MAFPLAGSGFKTPMHIHHRPPDARLTRDPVPGLLSGGPNPDQQDRCDYPSDLPAKSFMDDWYSCASNEITINWNAPRSTCLPSSKACNSAPDFLRNRIDCENREIPVTIRIKKFKKFKNCIISEVQNSRCEIHAP